MARTPPSHRPDRRAFLASVGAVALAGTSLGQVVRKGGHPTVRFEVDLRRGWAWRYRFREVITAWVGEAAPVERFADLTVELRSDGEEEGRIAVLRGWVSEARLVWPNGEAAWPVGDGDATLDESSMTVRVDPGLGLVGLRMEGPLSAAVRDRDLGPWAGAMRSDWLAARLGPVFDAEGRIGEEVELGSSWDREVVTAVGSAPARAVVERWTFRFAADATAGLEAAIEGGVDGGGVVVEGQTSTRWDVAGDILGERIENVQARGVDGEGREYRVNRRRSLRRAWAHRSARSSRRGR